MVGVVNPPAVSFDGTLEAYRSKSAAFTGKADDAANAFGGQLIFAGSVDSGSTAAPYSTATLTTSKSSPSIPNSTTGSRAAKISVLLGGLGMAIWVLL
ncbi:hypothetical protein BKA67DRAFT_96824 [Truncatella angustata]|uniref:Uncharacterized protein n=1 Tax=Truncatella angustata TaxID=152316 RepID=A0A9P8UCT3_9PEZI|nr:uncharacterized protein BKA67DRAFT_96824 [Truncatella angustata]KAH6646222.1 hypothetical protein BKA67DRAFT_96824 [Truncatella angustata]